MKTPIERYLTVQAHPSNFMNEGEKDRFQCHFLEVLGNTHQAAYFWIERYEQRGDRVITHIRYMGEKPLEPMMNEYEGVNKGATVVIEPEPMFITEEVMYRRREEMRLIRATVEGVDPKWSVRGFVISTVFTP